MTEQEKQRQIDALVERIDAFMKNGGGRMRVTGGEGAGDLLRRLLRRRRGRSLQRTGQTGWA